MADHLEKLYPGKQGQLPRYSQYNKIKVVMDWILVGYLFKDQNKNMHYVSIGNSAKNTETAKDRNDHTIN